VEKIFAVFTLFCKISDFLNLAQNFSHIFIISWKIGKKLQIPVFFPQNQKNFPNMQISRVPAKKTLIFQRSSQSIILTATLLIGKRSVHVVNSIFLRHRHLRI
jgi:hypothetical protein